MRRSKSSQKEAIRGFEDEIKDYVSQVKLFSFPISKLSQQQPLKSLNLFNNDFMKRLSVQKPPVVASQGLKDRNAPKTYSWRHYLSQEQLQIATKAINTPAYKEAFNIKMIKEFAEGLGGDSLECYKHMYDVRSLHNKEVLSHYGNIYKELHTIPVVFLSVVKTKQQKVKAIYLWQFNEMCPIDRVTSRMQIDWPTRNDVYAPHHSMLLLAKFVTSEGEELLDGQFLSDSRILIKSSLSGGSHLRFREYDMMDLKELVKVNPYEARVDNRFYCASKLDISLDVSEMNCEVSRIRRLGEIELLEYHQKEAGVESLPMFIKTDSQKMSIPENIWCSELFSEVYSMRMSGYTVLIDRRLAKMILFKKDSLKIVDLSVVGQICSIYQNNYDVFYFLNNEGKVFRTDENFHCENLEILNIKAENNVVKFLSAHNSDYAVYLEGAKFYAIVMTKGGTLPQLLFDVETTLKEEEEKPNIKLVWEVTQDKVVALKGSSVYVYDFKSNGLEKRELQQTELLEYKYTNLEWRLLSDKKKVLAFSQDEETLKIKALALKENQVKKSEKQFKVGDIYTNYLVGELRKSEGNLFVRVSGTADQIIFLRLKDPYFIDDLHIVNGIPCYLFSTFVFPPKVMANKDWAAYYQKQNAENESKKLNEEKQKKVEKEEKEMEEYKEMKAKVTQHMKDVKQGKNQNQEETKEKMKDLRKAIVKSGKEEGADKLDKNLKDVKEEYMSMYQDLKKEKKQNMKEKERNKNKDRKNDRNNKRGEY